MKKNTLFLAALYNIEIEEDLGKGIQLDNNLRITNNTSFIESLFDEHFIDTIGYLEYSAILNISGVIVYKIEPVEIDQKNVDHFVSQNLMIACLYLGNLWIVKDNSISIMLGIAQFPYLKPSNLLVLPQTFPVTHSNSMTMSSFFLANGKTKTTIFNSEELKTGKKYGEDSEISEYNDSLFSNTMMAKASRITRSTYFVQLARGMSDLGLKIANYCTALECLFASSSTELKHKLSERISLFLSNNYLERQEIYSSIGTAYNIRSRVVHGDIIPEKNLNELPSISENCDQVIRRVFQKLEASPELDIYFREPPTSNSKAVKMKKEFEFFFQEIILGKQLI